jgi:ABC-type glycerol-3-phosphate transport system substrate-binding protein
MKKIALIMAMIMMFSAALTGCGKKDEETKVQPTFMYFVAKSDASYNEAMAVVGELQKEYGKKVKFMVQDVDENPELKERYMINLEDSPINIHTPTLIMLDTNNDISSFGQLSECTDKEKLKAEIEKALNK